MSDIYPKNAIITPDYSEPLQGVILKKAYNEYVRVRDLSPEFGDTSPFPWGYLQEANQAREKIAQAASNLYDNGGANVLRKYLQLAIPLGSDFSQELGKATPGYDPLTPTPIEASIVTVDNINIAKEFATSGKDTLTGLLLSGSTAWGPFFAPKGDGRLVPYKIGKPEAKRSDADMIACAPDIEAIGETIDKFISDGLIDESEAERFAEFRRLYADNKADLFSVKSKYRSAKQSIHFMTEDLLDDISLSQPTRQPVDGVNVLHDFRPDKPNNPTKNGLGYTIDDLKGFIKTHHMPQTQEVTTPNGKSLGYICESPIGKIHHVNGEETYQMGLLDFFLAIRPLVLHDTNGRVQEMVSQMQNLIAEIQGSSPIKQLPRQKLIANYMLDKIRKDLSS